MSKVQPNQSIKYVWFWQKMIKSMITIMSYVSAAPARTSCSAPNQGRYCLLHGLTGARPPHIPLPHPPWQMVCGRSICPPMPPYASHTHTPPHTHPAQIFGFWLIIDIIHVLIIDNLTLPCWLSQYLYCIMSKSNYTSKLFIENVCPHYRYHRLTHFNV